MQFIQFEDTYMPRNLKRMLFLTLIAAELLLGLDLYAQQSAPFTAPNPLQQSFVAMAGSGTPIQDITIIGSVDYEAGSTRESGNITLKAALGGNASVVFSLPSAVHKEVRSQASGQRAGAWTDGAEMHQYSWQNLQVEPYWFAPELYMASVYDGKKWRVASSEAGSGDAGPWLHLKIVRNSPTEMPLNSDVAKFGASDVVLNTENRMPQTIAYRQFEASHRFQPTNIRFQYDDYRAVNGHLVPFHIQRYINATLNLDIHVQTVQLNTNLQPSDFTLQ